jgi:two-component system sensor histidine kinase KdpD
MKGVLGAPRVKGRFGFRTGFGWVIAIYVLTMVGMLGYTLFTFESQKSDAVVIDLAGRQRMLNSQHMMQILLISHGGKADYRYTRRILHQTLDSLIVGGEAIINLGKNETEILPAAPTEAIRQKLEEQKELIKTFTEKADTFLQLSLNDPFYQEALEELRNLNIALHAMIDNSVKMLAGESRAKVTKMLKGQIVVVFMVGFLGVLLTWQLNSANRDREKEILDRQKAQEDLRKSEAQILHALRQSDTLKSALLSSVSHELRTPLTSIKAMVSRSLKHSGEEVLPPNKDHLDSINQEIDHLTRLVENLLDMSRVEAGELKPKRDWELLEDLVEGAIGLLGKSLRERELQLDLEEDLPPVFIDGVQVQQVLVNLLENAIKYSKESSAIGLKMRRDGDVVEVQVSNTGEGIPQEEIPRIFDRFYRVPSQQRRSIRGTGLGLAICKGIIEAHGGRIWVESIPGHTTTFSFSLPLVLDHQ